MTDVDMMTAIVLEQLGANREQLRTLEPARRAPHLLDDHTVERIKQVFGEQRVQLFSSGGINPSDGPLWPPSRDQPQAAAIRRVRGSRAGCG
ncbi:hypothetical protein ABGB18_44360 [Nonomuraea sp. B12E4]|uniref:hypothetical protein n=1 Tax=Nonomuraea sp. B12E4 TaxID=3153564 RepID=UPI00325D1424